MNIVMIGHSSAGKTTFMAALYYRMTNVLYDYKMRYDWWANYWYKRYTLGNHNFSLEEAQKEEKELETISKNINSGIYPPPTAIKQEYVFKMRYKNFNEIAFNWFDYRGGALMERTGQSDDSASLLLKIKASAALIVFLDGTKLEEGIAKNERYFRRLIYLVKNAISNINVEDGHYYPISFVITKDDLCRDAINSEGFDYFYENIFKDITTSTKIAGLITFATVNKDNIYNVHWPLFFSINHCIHQFIDEVVSSYQSRENNRGFFGSIKEFWTDEDKSSTMRMINELQESSQALNKILQENDNQSLILI